MEKSPRNLIVCEKHNFNTDQSHHQKQVFKHSFNLKMSLLIPECGVLPMEMEKVINKFNSYYHVQDLPVCTFLQEHWLETVIKKGGLYALSYKTRIDEDCVVAVLPNGQMILSVDKDAYEQLGLEGKPSLYNHRQIMRYIITVDLKSLVPGTKQYMRVLRGLRERVPLKTDFLLSTDGTGSLVELLSKYLYEEHRPTVRCQTLQNLPCPSLHSPDLRGEGESCSPIQFLEWLGAVNLGISSENSAAGFLSTYECPEPHSSVDQVLLCTVTGLIPPRDVCTLLKELRRYFEEPRFTNWGSLTMHGFADSPVSWGAAEHGFLKGGENLYNFVCFKNQDYWLHLLTGTQDACPP